MRTYIFSGDLDHHTRHGREANIFLAPAKGTWSKKQKECERIRRRSMSAKNEVVNCEEFDWAELLLHHPACLLQSGERLC
jgi:hypothetical protein